MRLLITLALTVFATYAQANDEPQRMRTSPIQMKPLDDNFALTCDLLVEEKLRSGKYRSAVQKFSIHKEQMVGNTYYSFTTTDQGWTIPVQRGGVPKENPQMAKNLAGHKITIIAQQSVSGANPNDIYANETARFGIESSVIIGGKTVSLESLSTAALRGSSLGTTLYSRVGKTSFNVYLRCQVAR